MRTASRQTQVDPDLHPFAADVDKYYTILFQGRRGPVQHVRLWVLDREFRAVACFRFSQAVKTWRGRHRVAGLLAEAVAAVWRRRASTIHHVQVDPRATIGPGFFLMHRCGVTIGPVTIGNNCVIHHNVTIGQRVAGGDRGVPRLGDGVWIGPGATITGDIHVGDSVTISAGSVVTRSIPARSLVAGNPGRVIVADYDNSAMMTYRLRREVLDLDAIERVM